MPDEVLSAAGVRVSASISLQPAVDALGTPQLVADWRGRFDASQVILQNG